MTSVLNNPTLVLNKSWQAHDAIIVRTAIEDVVGERARIVCPATYPDPAYHYQTFDIMDWMQLDAGSPCIRTARTPIRIPEVIIFSEFDKMPPRKVVFSRKNLWKRDRYVCQYCGKRPPNDEITMDHILPKIKGGISSFENCVLACLRCNTKKGGRTPREASMQLQRPIMRANGKVRFMPYEVPKVPEWNPLYNLSKVRRFPESWKEFLQTKNDELYWNVELET